MMRTQNHDVHLRRETGLVYSSMANNDGSWRRAVHPQRHSSSSERIQEPNPFGTPSKGTAPRSSIPASSLGSAINLARRNVSRNRRYFHSRRIERGTVEKPWLKHRDPREKWVTIIPLIGLFMGLCITGVLIWDGLKSVHNFEYCPVLMEDFLHGLDPRIWTKEAEVGGYGNGQFEETTATEENCFVQDGMLVIQPTIVDEKVIENNRTVTNLTRSGVCTAESNVQINCVATTNLDNGTIVNPVHSARVNTKAGASIRFGRVEVVAQLPTGDWLWPAIWMLPTRPEYGAWPASGEIDIAESRGNNYTFAQGGNNIVSSTIHWGPTPDQDAWWRNFVKRKALHTTYADGFHTFGLEWSEKYIFTYVDSRLYQVMYNDFNKPFWQRGQFPPADANGTALTDPWSWTGNTSAPFDQDFYLILNVAVGGTNHWFKDGEGGKPWVDADPTSKWQFWKARGDWEPTWGRNSRMIVKSVKMWQQKGYDGCGAHAKKLTAAKEN